MNLIKGFYFSVTLGYGGSTVRTPCQNNRHRLPQAWIDIINRKITNQTGKWEDYNVYWKARETLRNAANDDHGIICESDVPPNPNVNNFPDLTSPRSVE